MHLITRLCQAYRLLSDLLRIRRFRRLNHGMIDEINQALHVLTNVAMREGEYVHID